VLSIWRAGEAVLQQRTAAGYAGLSKTMKKISNDKNNLTPTWTILLVSVMSVFLVSSSGCGLSSQRVETARAVKVNPCPEIPDLMTPIDERDIDGMTPDELLENLAVRNTCLIYKARIYERAPSVIMIQETPAE